MAMTSPSLPLTAAHAVPASRARWSHAVVALAISFAWLAATAWLRPLTLPDEGRYVGVALEMLHSHRWSVPTLDGLPFFHKPPLFYWITAGAMSVFGVTEWAARLAALLGATLGAGALYMLARRWAGQRAARLSLLVLLTQPLWFMGAQFANMDMLVAGCITATIALLAHAALQMHAGQPWQRALLAACVFAGLGVLAKGLIGAVIPALVIVAWLASLRRWRTIAALLWLPGIAVFAGVALPWFVRMQWEFPGFFHYFIVVQHIERFAQSGFNNAEPAWFYLAVLGVLSLPWLAWLALATNRRYRQRVLQQPLLLLMWIWLAVVVVFFSLPQSKLIGYVFPAVPPLAFLMADAAATVRRRRLGATAVLAAILCVGVALGLALRPPVSNRALAQAFAAQRLPNEPLVFVDEYFYDFGFYAGSATLPVVVNEWASPDVLKHDNWRHELADAASFAPDTAAARLVDNAALPARLCGARVTWVVGAHGAASRYPFLKPAQPVADNDSATLWRVDRTVPAVAAALACR